MLFNSWEFWCFFVVVYGLYLAIPRTWLQNVLLLAASYFFYASWNWKFLGLILASTLVDYLCGLGIHGAKSAAMRRVLLTVSLCFNLGMLGVFKYYDFFASSLLTLLAQLGFHASLSQLEIVLPVGISFYTFQTLSYTIDIYRRQMKPTSNLLNFSLFVAFFPQLVAGPIERAKRFLPQIEAPRTLDPDALTSAVWLVGWGLWKKIVVADNLAIIVDRAFDFSADTTAAMSYLAVVGFSMQIYCDFSGYSDIARGLARLLGFELMLNFDLPFVARNPSEFWRRWHISLSTWLRDYLYIPLGGNRGSTMLTYRNLFLTMTLGGLWHGASWNFVWWGMYHGCLLAAHRAFRQWRPAPLAAPMGMKLLQWFTMFHCTVFGFLIFRCNRRVTVDGIQSDDSYQQFVEMVGAGANGLGLDGDTLAALSRMSSVLLPLFLMQWFQYRTGDHCFVLRWPFLARTSVYAALLLLFIVLGVSTGDAFIYFLF